jgi:hypothetical protein
MKKYVVFQCSECGLPQYARNDRKSRECPRCSVVNVIEFAKIKVLLQTDSVKEAFEAVAYAKMRKDLFVLRDPTHTRSHSRTQFLKRVNRY